MLQIVNLLKNFQLIEVTNYKLEVNGSKKREKFVEQGAQHEIIKSINYTKGLKQTNLFEAVEGKMSNHLLTLLGYYRNEMRANPMSMICTKS